MRIVVDTREKRPYDLVDVKKAALKTGDYSVEGFEDLITIERKSYSDIYSCLTSARARFAKQLKRMSAFPFKILLIDTTVSAFLLGHPSCDLPGEVALQRLYHMTVPMGVPVCFVDHQGPKVARNLLYQFSLQAER